MDQLLQLFLEPLTLSLMIIGWVIAILLLCFYCITKSRALLNCIPGIFTSLGLLGTFVAICSSLGGISSSQPIIDNVGKTVEEVQQAGSQLNIMQIIRELIPAFTSSIGGLVFALLWTVVTKVIFAYEDKKDDAKVNKTTPDENLYSLANTALSTQELIEKRFQSLETKLIELSLSNNATTQQASKDIVNSLKDQAEQSRNNIERLNTTVAQQSSILERFINDFVNRMDDIFTQMHERIEQQIHDFGEEQFTKSSVVLQEIANQLSAVSTNLVTNQEQSVQTMMENTNEKLQVLTDTIASNVSTMNTHVTDVLNDMGAKQNEEIGKLLTQYVEAMNIMNEQSVGFVEQISQLKSDTTTAIQELHNQQTSELNAMTAASTEAMKAMQVKQDAEIDTIVAKFNTLTQTLTEQSNAMTVQMQKQMGEEYAKVEQHNAESLQKMAALQSSYQTLTSQMLEGATAMNQQTVDQLRTSIAQFVNDLQDAIGTQCKALNDALTLNVEALNKCYDSIKSTVHDVKENYNQSAQSFRQAVILANRYNERADKTLNAFDESLKSVIASNKELQDSLQSVLKQHSQIDQLKSRISEINASIASLQRVESMLNRFMATKQ